MQNLSRKKTTCATCDKPIKKATQRAYAILLSTMGTWPRSDGKPRHRECVK